MAAEFGLFNGLGFHSDCVGAMEVRTAGGGDLGGYGNEQDVIFDYGFSTIVVSESGGR